MGFHDRVYDGLSKDSFLRDFGAPPIDGELSELSSVSSLWQASPRARIVFPFAVGLSSMLVRRALMIGGDIHALLLDVCFASGVGSETGRCKPHEH